ncbi:subtilisin-like protein [Backusella circina FSU 941]|nr:subtilisin-like protein [Backusella circina FSU 941]
MVNVTLLTITSVILSLTSSIVCKETSRIPHTYVIEFERPVESFATKRHLEESRRIDFYQQLDRWNINYNVRHEYDVVNAVSLSFMSTQDSSLFFDHIQGYRKAWPVNTITKPQVFRAGATDPSEIATLFDYFNTTGIIRVRRESGLTGQGVHVGVIDTGVDYMHPALGGCFGPGCLVDQGYDFVGDDYTGSNIPKPDDDPRDTCNGHGTHVTGIIAANDTVKGFTGVAPSVHIGAYRIFGCHGSSSDDMIMKAMERAYLDGMDVINMSLGDNGWPESPAALLADVLALKGMIVCAAAGNEGSQGVFQVGAPSLGRHALSVASVDNTRVLAHAFEIGKLVLGYTTSNGQVFNFTTGNIVATSSEFLNENDGCGDIDVDLEGKVALMARGGCTFTEKILNVQSAGAIGAIIYNNVPGPITPSAPSDAVKIEYGGISLVDGFHLFEYLEQSTNNTAEFPQVDKSFPVTTGGSVSSFSSWGLGPDLSIKPDLSAPGGYIFSTYPLDLGSYAILSGTSMATPFVSGVVALIQESRGGHRGIAVNDLRSMLINTANPVNVYQSETTTIVDSVAKQGSGLIDIYRALKSDTTIFPEQIRLNDPSHHAPNNEYTFIIHNHGSTPSDYIIGHQLAASVQGYGFDPQVERLLPLTTPKLIDNVTAIVDIKASTVHIEANQQVNVTVVISPPANALEVPPTIYSGFITVTKGDQIYSIPYAGFSADTSKLPVLMSNSTMPRVQNIDRGVSVSSPAVLIFQLVQASPLVTISVVDSAEKVVGLIPGGYNRFLGRNIIDSANDAYVLPWFGNVANNTEQASLGSLHAATPLTATESEQPIQADDFPMIGTFLKPGEYRLKLQALTPFGNKSVETDFDVWFSPIIEVKAPKK